MPEQITLTYTNGTKDTAAAMLAGGAMAGKKYRDWTFILLSWAVVALIGGGGGFVALAIWVLFFDQNETFVFLLPLCTVLALVIGRWSSLRMFRAQAKMTTNSRFGRLPQRLTCDSSGIILQNDYATWQTDWRGVETVDKTRHGLVLGVSGIVFPIPDAAFKAGPDKQAVLDQLLAWHQAAQ